MADEGFRKGSTGYDEPLYYEYCFQLGDASIRFLCCNTAWFSRREERQGELFFPAKAMPEVRSADNAVTVALLHHP